MGKLPILMYHNISTEKSKSFGLCISENNLEEQFRFLSDKGYKTYHFENLKTLNSIPTKSIVITFDDVTENQYLLALPLLIKYQLKATFFIPFAYIGKNDSWNDGNEKLMSIEQLKTMQNPLFEFGYHSFSHQKYSEMGANEIEQDMQKCKDYIQRNDLKVSGALAYPFGNYPKSFKEKQKFKEILEENNIQFGLKIGNRPNHFPFKNKYEIKRIDIKGEDSLTIFKWKIRLGKLKLF
jgi:peptidoglycan/xylan/chitin deacetylase (PgdA/CDA1 family)